MSVILLGIGGIELISRSSAVRQQTLEALAALHLYLTTRDEDLWSIVGPKSFPLSMSKLVKLLSVEGDEAVLAVLLRTIREVLTVGAADLKVERR